MSLSSRDQQEIDSVLRQFEHETGVQAVAAVIEKADAYPELPWKAYALGSALGAVSVLVVPFLVTDWSIAFTIAAPAMAILGTGAVLAAAAAFVPPFARLFLDRLRGEAEARQYALAMFLDRELFGTGDRRAVLVLVSRFERVAVILPDRGVQPYAPRAELDRIAGDMRGALRRGIAPAFAAAFAGLRTTMIARGFQAAPDRANALSDEIVAEKGA